MSEFDFKFIHKELPEQLLHKSFLWIWNADKIPPHIGISRGKDYFSLTYRKSERLQTASMLKKAKRSLIPLVLVEIPENILVSDLGSVFLKYDRAIGDVTCLKPIKEVMQIGNRVNQLADLLNYLDSNGLIVSVNGLNLPEEYKGIPDYSMEDILKRIEILNEKS